MWWTVNCGGFLFSSQPPGEKGGCCAEGVAGGGGNAARGSCRLSSLAPLEVGRRLVTEARVPPVRVVPALDGGTLLVDLGNARLTGIEVDLSFGGAWPVA